MGIYKGTMSNGQLSLSYNIIDGSYIIKKGNLSNVNWLPNVRHKDKIIRAAAKFHNIINPIKVKKILKSKIFQEFDKTMKKMDTLEKIDAATVEKYIEEHSM